MALTPPEDTRNGHADIYFSSRTVTGTWSANLFINDAYTGTRSYPMLAVDRAGNAYAAWYDTRYGHDDIYFSYRPAGGSWGANVAINDTGAGDRTLS